MFSTWIFGLLPFLVNVIFSCDTSSTRRGKYDHLLFALSWNYHRNSLVFRKNFRMLQKLRIVKTLIKQLHTTLVYTRKQPAKATFDQTACKVVNLLSSSIQRCRHGCTSLVSSWQTSIQCRAPALWRQSVCRCLQLGKWRWHEQSSRCWIKNLS